MYDVANGFYVDWILSELRSIGGLIFHSLPSRARHCCIDVETQYFCRFQMKM